MSQRCPICRHLYAPPYEVGSQRARSIDHILPRAWGGTNMLHGAVRNVRPMCVGCNGLRGSCGHCVGAVAAVLAVAEIELVDPRTVARRWKMRMADLSRRVGKRTLKRILRGAAAHA